MLKFKFFHIFVLYENLNRTFCSDADAHKHDKMKKVIIVIAAVFGFAVMASAQPKAIGGRLGYGLEASYQHYFGKPHFMEINAGFGFLGGKPGFNATGTYNFTFAQPSWTPRGNWAWYAGPGITLGSTYYNDDHNFFFGIVGQIGLEYKFWFPLQLSADLRPAFGMCDGEFWKDGLVYSFVPTLSVRYSF